VAAATLGYARAVGGKGDRPTVENRWWVDQGKDAQGAPLPRPPATFGGRFFRTGAGFEQERARIRLTDSNLKWLEEGNPPAGGWSVVYALAEERFPAPKLARAQAALTLPPGARGVLIDAGDSLRAVVTGEPVGERLVEIRLGADCSFDAWVHGEWVREAFFRNFDDALRRAPALLREYVATRRAAPVI
jgi:hypothetical protein